MWRPIDTRRNNRPAESADDLRPYEAVIRCALEMNSLFLIENPRMHRYGFEKRRVNSIYI